jgi:hypothetical protein
MLLLAGLMVGDGAAELEHHVFGWSMDWAHSVSYAVLSIVLGLLLFVLFSRSTVRGGKKGRG